MVMTVSEYSRSLICEWAGLDVEQVVIARNGVSTAFLDDATGPRLNDSKLAVLLVSNEKPYKNNHLAFASLRHLPLDFVLHTVGLSDSTVERLSWEAGVDYSRVIAHGRLSDNELSLLYRSSQCLALPSSIEGFGLPALEAMAVGTPTVYVAQAVSEVVGVFGFQVANRASAEEFASLIMQASMAKSSMSRQLMKRASHYTWEATASAFDRSARSLLGTS